MDLAEALDALPKQSHLILTKPVAYVASGLKDKIIHSELRNEY